MILWAIGLRENFSAHTTETLVSICLHDREAYGKIPIVRLR